MKQPLYLVEYPKSIFLEMKFKQFAMMMLNITAVYSATSEGLGLTYEQGSAGWSARTVERSVEWFAKDIYKTLLIRFEARRQTNPCGVN